MKKILLALFALVIVITFVFPVTVFAEDGEALPDIAETSSNVVTDDESKSTVTFLDRMWDAFTSEKNGILDRAVDMIILVAFAVLAKITSSFKNKVSADIINLGINNNAQAKTQGDFNKDCVKAINTLADEIKAFESKFDSVLQDEHAVASLLTIDTTLLEIMTTIYPNAKIPQGIKDIVAEKYANCLKIVNSDDRLSAIMDAIHGVDKEVISNDGKNEEQGA